MIKKVSIIDYGVGNIRSVRNAISSLGMSVSLTNDKEIIMNSDAIILPGVGSYTHGMKNLNNLSMPSVINQYNDSGRPIIGICLGMQLLFEGSEEFEKTKGLGLIKGNVRKLKNQSGMPLPHIGWEEVKFLNAETENNFDYFFCHSYVAHPENTADIIATSKYGQTSFCAAIQRKNIVGFQFHPEKSGENGVKLIKQYITKFEENAQNTLRITRNS